MSCSTCTMGGATSYIRASFETSTIDEMEKFIIEFSKRTNQDPDLPTIETVPNDEPQSGEFKDRLEKAIKEHCTEPAIEVNANLRAELRRYRREKKRGPKLEVLYSNFRSIQVTSVEAERNFSLAGRFCSKLRSKLGDASLSALTMLHYYFKSNY